ncbi:alpha beta-hydrolase [Desarmillaria tabescens]|uniref:Alpha beta-hydrolase n=1 Tax=Armillaria tabescens TaxID=1929756 RepID=A0AA39N9P9_ARMTA|nr:alpha beta-hydrolase [Desarmillaria tabescens]KAK0461631.1 alpha beta-hydrolase [Desarmillaria tabescens]
MSPNASSPLCAPYGTWKSPIDAKLISEAGLSVEDLLVDDITRELYVLESRPSEGGRNAIVSASDNRDIYGPSWNARSRIHEYGGAPALAHDRRVYFSNITDGRVYVVDTAKRSIPTAVTPAENPSHRYGDFTLHPKDKKWLVSILEDHTVDSASGIKTSLVAINTLTQESKIIASGSDFYSNPRFSPDGRFIVWKEWNFPYMPIQASNLMLAPFSIPDDADAFPSVGAAVLVSGGNGKINGEPTWTLANELVFTTDKDGYLNPWILRGISSATPQPEPLSPVVIPEEFGEPSWFLGLSSFALYDQRRVLFSSFRNGRSQLYLASLDTREFLPVETPFVLIQHVRSLGDGKVVFVGKKADDNSGVIEFSWSEQDQKPIYRVLRGRTDLPFPKGLISLPEPVELQVLPEGRTTHAILYLPKNPDYSGGLPGELPPAIFNLHGGPNSMLDQALDWTKQYYSSRGWAWQTNYHDRIDLNYNGSTGYGRDYMDRLQGQWGVVDVRDSVEALRELGKRRLIDVNRSAIRGRSGGGFTTLQTLSTTTDNFKAGTAWFPASDLIALHVNCHKFQSQYIPGLVGALLEEDSALWKKRSPFYQASQIKAPVLVCGYVVIDRIVPPEQTQDMAKTIEANGGSVKYIEFEGEGHGWRKADSIRRSIEEELSFYQERFGLKGAP